MLNELRELSISLEKAGIIPPDFHPKFPECPKKAAYWVFLDYDGNVAGISSIPVDQVQKIRKWEGVGSNGISFPAVSMPPLLKVVESESRKKLAAMKRSNSVSQDEVLEIDRRSTNLWSDCLGKKTNAFDKINECLQKSVKDLQSKLTDVPDEFSAITELLLRASKIDSVKLYEQLHEGLIKSISKGESKKIEALFFYGENKPTSQDDFQIVFEVKEVAYFPANHQQVQNWMNSKLLASTAPQTSTEVDAFGCNAAGKDAKFPDVAFKNALGNVKLRSMTKDIPCQSRYGMIEHSSFSAGNEVRKEMKRALEWLGAEERKGKTWCDLSRRMERPMLLFAYPAVIPQDLPDLAGMLGDAEEEAAETSREQFSLFAEKVAVALRGRSKETVDCEIHIFVLAKRKGDARTKVIASSRFMAEHVIRSAQRWQAGSHNLPNIEVRCFGESKGEKPVWKSPMVPFPAEMIWCLNTVWMIGRDDKGERYSRAKGGHGFTVNDALCLLLGEGIELQQVANRALGAVLRNSFSLLLALGQARAQGLVQRTEKKYSKQPLLLPSILGLLLHKLGHTKGEIMTSPAFLVGRLLNLADSLHIEYCRHVRNNSVPPQLVGNALMATALETPEKALSMLSQRVLPYQAWARTVKGGEEINLARFFLKHLGEVSEQLKDSPLPQRSSDADKAQMLLGYLARAKQD